MWDSLLANIAVIALVLVIWQAVADGTDLSDPRRAAIVLGGLMGLAGCLSIIGGAEVLPGIRVDLRTATVASAAFFGGPIAALIAGGLTGGTRLYYGGDGTLPALVAIMAAALVALFLRRRMGQMPATYGWIALLSLGVSLSYGFAYIFIPWEKLGAVFSATFFPMFALNFVTTAGMASLSLKEIKRQDLVRTNALYRQIVESLPDPIVAKDPHGVVVAANSAAADMYGVSDFRDLLGRQNHQFLPPEIAARASEEEQHVLDSGEAFCAERQNLGMGPLARWMSIQKIAVYDSSDRTIGVVFFGRDITEQRRLLQMKSDFVSLVSHELRTPMTSVRGALGLLEGSLPDTTSDAATNLLSIARRNSDRLIHLINDILDVEKIEDGNLDFEIAPHPLGLLIREALPSLENYMPEMGVSIELEEQEPGLIVDVDPGRFEQIVSNLVSNAIKFSLAGGTVTIALKRQGPHVILSVGDRGSGISEEFQDRIFGRFEQSDSSDTRSKGGTGLGLHIAQVFVEKMGGTIRFESVEGEGTTFFVRFPLSAEAVVPQVSHEEDDAGESLESLPRILYIEDDSSLGSILTELLAGEVRVDHVTTLKAARAALAQTRYDLMVVDDELPDGSGLTLLEAGDTFPPAIVFTARDVPCAPNPRILNRFIKTRVKERDVVDAIRMTLRPRQAA